VSIAIASGALRHEIEVILAGGGLEGVVPVIVAAARHRAASLRRSVRTGNRVAVERHGRPLSPARSVGIEDSHWGLQSARDAGLRTIGLTTSYPASLLEPT
jgi:beta-phosphoglucomutase-like phosphatase (HAD superfamily)